ncbi:MAG TPA: hypothetical protein VGL81_25635 [Polyangiaceae bacterium]|jgi:hypothetical protein
MNAYRNVFALVLPLALAHCSMPSSPAASSTVSSESIQFAPTLDAASGQPLPVVVGEPWVVGAQLLVSYVECGDSDDFSVSQDYVCTTRSPAPVAFDVVSASCDDDLCEIKSLDKLGDESSGVYPMVSFTVVVKAPSATLHVTAQMTGNPSVMAEQDLAISASLPGPRTFTATTTNGKW